ncbi:DoxX family protein [Paenibacillus filicis]|uniref:DoxX family protein n=1 Tax=Paenibacillus gyeongsangnamensis TaxID=3388067 RepID=A0ABT4QEA7_9BACL|nr:DoxX family protein [Paenibacillus filicis]MCZ8515209.1 DoxX family protein [Paenibacillus filicis]
MTTNISKGRLWTARIMSGIIILFMLFDSIMKLIKPAPVVEGTVTLGYAEHHIVVIGILGLLSTILYAVPRTSFLGALLLTGYFGGVVATHVRMDNPLFTHILFPVYLAVLTWGGVWLRDENVRRLIPFQNNRLDRRENSEQSIVK